jgi:hypothetical protein
MCKLKLSRNVKQGDVVSVRGGKYIRCSRLSQPVGVWRNSETIKLRDMNGDLISVNIPAGAQVYGVAQVKVVRL